MIWRHDAPPRDGTVFIADVGMPWACASVFDGASGKFCCTQLSVDLYLGDWCDRYFECENQTTLPFKILKLTAEDQFNDYLDAYMRGRGIPTMSEALTKRFRQSLFEIFLNASIHSQSKAGIFVCGQFYPNKHRLDFTIADAGVGIRENVRRYTRKPKLSSCKAIEWAMTEGNTTKTGNQPGGLGLKLIKDFIQMNGGKIQVVSRYGYYDFSANGESIRKMRNDFHGTCINIEINTDDTSSYCLKSELKSEDIF